MRTVNFLFTILVLTGGVMFAQTSLESSPTKKSFRQALSLTQNALKKIQGDKDFEQTNGIRFVAEGEYDLSTRMQGLKSDVPDLVPIKEIFGYTPKTGAVLCEPHARVNHDADEWMRFVYDGEGRMLIVSQLDKWAIWTTNSGVESQRRRYSRIVPQVILKEALKYRQTLRYHGVSKVLDEELETVSFFLPSNETLTLFFSKKEGLFRGTEYLIDHPLSGDTTVRWMFSDYKQVNDFGLFPFSYEVFLGKKRLKSVRIKEIHPKFEISKWTKSTNGISISEPPEIKPKQTTAAKTPQKKKSLAKGF